MATRSLGRCATPSSGSATSRRWPCCRRSPTPDATPPDGAGQRRPAKLRALSKQVPRRRHRYRYDEFEACLEQVDAVYIALPNSMHAEYTDPRRAAPACTCCAKSRWRSRWRSAGDDRCLPRNRVKLMIAYRLHFEAINLQAIDLVRRGRIGEPKYLQLVVFDAVREGDIRTKRELGGGTLYDIGVYCINAARYLFRARADRGPRDLGEQRQRETARDRRIDGRRAAVRRRPRRDVRDQLQRGGRRLPIASSAPRDSCASIQRTSTPKGWRTS